MQNSKEQRKETGNKTASVGSRSAQSPHPPSPTCALTPDGPGSERLSRAAKAMARRRILALRWLLQSSGCIGNGHCAPDPEEKMRRCRENEAVQGRRSSESSTPFPTPVQGERLEMKQPDGAQPTRRHQKGRLCGWERKMLELLGGSGRIVRHQHGPGSPCLLQSVGQGVGPSLLAFPDGTDTKPGFATNTIRD
ncbi:uncharacterized protein [Symphalangus syndactylus]|uniref:uncharacterized protein isoform X2 n=2 Tax=Symphalangus syndactylus TaxID=9590 RepID=UPI003004AFE9